MTDLNIPNLNKKSEKYLFKNKFALRRKSKTRLLIESFFMSVLGFTLIYLFYLIPDKSLIFNNTFEAIEKSFVSFIQIASSLYQILIERYNY